MIEKPNVFKWSLKYALISAVTGMICCVAPAVLFMLGIMGGVVAISFADFFYTPDGSLGLGSLILRIIAVGIGVLAFFIFKRKQNQCSIEPKRKRLNLILLLVLLALFGVVFFLTLEFWSTWYFDEYIVPQQKVELKQ